MSLLSSLFAPPRPMVAIEFSATNVTVVRLAANGSSPALAGFATEPLPAGSLKPALNTANVVDRTAVLDALRRACDGAGVRAGHAAVVVPDPVGKVSLLRFEQVPAKTADLTELIRWQVRKSVPFPIEDAQLTFAQGAIVDGAREFVVVLARRDIIAEFETLARDAGVAAGVVDLATFNLVNAALAAGGTPSGDWLLVHVASDYLTLAVLRQSDLILLRHRGAEDATSLADIVHQTSMYYEDRLRGAGFDRVILAGSGRAASGTQGEGTNVEAIRRELETRLQTRVEPIDPRPAITLTDRIGATPALLDTLAPAVGVLLRERVA
jgi:type IV pilus assembly protein PilM